MAYGAVNTASKANAARSANGSTAGAQAEGNGSVSAAATDSPAEDGSGASLWARTRAFYENNIGLFFVFLAQIFASIVSLAPFLRPARKKNHI